MTTTKLVSQGDTNAAYSATRFIAVATAIFAAMIGMQVAAGAAAEPLDERAEEAEAEFFEQQVRPLLVLHCYECHGPDAEPAQGDLRLDSRAGWQRGGALGPAIVPGEPERSLLWEAVHDRSERLQMPPAGRLAEQELHVLRRWIERGAYDPRTEEPASAASESPPDFAARARQLWSLQPIPPQRPAPTLPPADTNTDMAWTSNWSTHPIDRWLVATWRRAGLRPVREAQRSTLIRRVTFDLTGLPPTPAEIDRFLLDERPDAYEQLIERLLASPAYGERWGRFWLDVARYADTNGLDENIAHGNAWRYRNYVIEAFNQDKPYDQFVREQLAGDLLPASPNWQEQQQRLVATGFLSLGPKVLAEVDETKMELDIIDEQVETVGRAFLALTLGCARCHDHKFDPITTRDYYGLAGIFKSTRTMEHFTKIARWNEVCLAPPEEQQAQAALAKELQQLQQRVQQRSQELEQARATLTGGSGALGEATDRAAELAAGDAELQALQDQLTRLQAAVVELPTAMSVTDRDALADLPVHIRGSHLTLGEIVGRGMPAVFATGDLPLPSIATGNSGRRELAEWLVDPRHPLTVRVLVNRLWRWHFGRGLVASTDNFGALGERPSQPELLDWLAAEFVRQDWSIKQFHRLLLSSRFYRLDCIHDPANAAIDPDNQFFWRANMRRLEAESVRDTLLAVSGRLQLGMQESFLPVKNREFVFDHTSKDETKYDLVCRSVYLPVIRNHVYDLFQLFDFPDESFMNSDRATTTVAPQSLFLLNSDLVLDCAEAFARQMVELDGTDEQRIMRGYRIAFGREPTEGELSRELRFLADVAGRVQVESSSRPAEGPADGSSAERPSKQAWTLLCHTWLCRSELIYVW